MRRWYVLYDGAEHACDFVSVNLFKKYLYLNLKGKTFKLVMEDTKDYEYAKRGHEVRVVAKTRTQLKPCKIIFK